MDGFANRTATADAPCLRDAAAMADDCGRCAVVEEADHRIANHLALLAGSVRLKAATLGQDVGPLPRSDVRLMLDGLVAQIDTIAGLHRSMAMGGRGATHIQTLLHDMCRDLAGTFPERLQLIEDLPCDALIAGSHVPALSQIVAEVITNAAKHAGQDGRAGRIVVRSSVTPVGGMVIEIEDDGPGLSADFDPASHNGLGFRLIRALGRKLGATISFEDASPGLRVRLELPQSVGAPGT